MLGLRDRNTMLPLWRLRMRRNHCRCLKKPGRGLTVISTVGSRVSCCRCICKARRSGWLCGRCCKRFLTEKRDLALEIARKRGIRSMSAQAVGGAVAHNPVSVIIPCHRVVGSHGSLTGYAGGLERKVRLLNLEGADLKGFFVPGRGTAL